MFGEVVPGPKCQPASTDVLPSTDVGRVSAIETGSVSVRRGVIRQKEEENNIVVQQTTSKVSPVEHNTNVVVDSLKNIGRLGVKQLSERFNALSQERDDAVGRHPGHVKRACDDDVKLGLKKTSSLLLCTGGEERRRGSVKDVQLSEYSRTLQGRIEGRGLQFGGQSEILTTNSADTGLGTGFGELGQETRRRR